MVTTSRASLPPRPRLGVDRVARRVPHRSTDGAVLLALRAARAPGWSPAEAAAMLRDLTHEDLAVLRRARTRLRLATRDRATVPTTRAIATLDLAIRALSGRQTA